MSHGRPPRLVTSLIQDQLTKEKYRILKKDLKCKTLKKERRAFQNIGKNTLYIPDCKIRLASFVLYFDFFNAGTDFIDQLSNV